ncbi:MAG: hypothetical protein KAH01_02455, partial [Caldisericia bacterium]|nr:hypothetical protein [Caldisericia bacterium]
LQEKDEYKENIEELLKPTRIYVKEALTLMKNCKVKGFANITGEGLLNIIRLNSNVKYVIDNALPILPIFEKIQNKGNIPLEEMYKDFNMGMGFLAVIDKKDFKKVSEALKIEQIPFKKVGFVEDSKEPQIEMREYNIISKNGTLVRE